MKSTPDLAAARFRAQALRNIRDFFAARGVLEVETPVLSRGISLDCHIDVFATRFHPGGYAPQGNPEVTSETFYLQTSPEPHMKRLLAQGFPDIYQIGKAFRNGERGARHNPEFTMIEWYRRGYSLARLMDEVEAVCRLVCGPLPVYRKTYREAFYQALGADPFDLSADEIARLPAVAARMPQGLAFTSKADALDFAMAHAVEPGFASGALTFVRDFPVEQAAQAQAHADDARMAQRFEVYAGGMELGNGYLELLDPVEYARRFDAENGKRRAAGKPELPKDANLLEALKSGLPPCAGVAMGLDRLILAGLGSGDIASVLTFPWDVS